MTIKIYKYRSLENETLTERTWDILNNNRVYLSSADQFNDPFELDFNFSFNAPLSKKKEFHKKENRTFFNKIKPLTPKFQRHKIEKWEETLDVESAKEEIKNTFRFCCFSKDPLNINQWTHYANGHRGICVEIEVTQNESMLIKMEYSPKLPILNFYHLDEGRISKANLCKTKDIRFAHERELRIFSKPLNEKYSALSEFGNISGVYLGCKFKDDTFLKTLKQNLPKIPIYQTHKSNIDVSLQKERIYI
jgi:hypothetical protein